MNADRPNLYAVSENQPRGETEKVTATRQDELLDSLSYIENAPRTEADMPLPEQDFERIPQSNSVSESDHSVLTDQAMNHARTAHETANPEQLSPLAEVAQLGHIVTLFRANRLADTGQQSSDFAIGSEQLAA